MERAYTIAELLIALTLVGVLTLLSAPRLADWTDRFAVARAADEAAMFIQRARLASVLRSAVVRVELTASSLRAVAEGPPDALIARAAGPVRRGVDATASRSVIRLAPNGLGLGAANTKLVFRRGEAAESLTVSRLGRLKRWR